MNKWGEWSWLWDEWPAEVDYEMNDPRESAIEVAGGKKIFINLSHASECMEKNWNYRRSELLEQCNRWAYQRH